jgi:hypothetical protein
MWDRDAVNHPSLPCLSRKKAPPTTRAWRNGQVSKWATNVSRGRLFFFHHQNLSQLKKLKRIKWQVENLHPGWHFSAPSRGAANPTARDCTTLWWQIANRGWITNNNNNRNTQTTMLCVVVVVVGSG